ncbi:MAG: hypothetical protein LBG21_03050 [Campylobacteraceae bacterium]|nr:hypothetical protein [Campylobacteraceae bacterium]
MSDKDKDALKDFERLNLGTGIEFNKTDFSKEEWIEIEKLKMRYHHRLWI